MAVTGGPVFTWTIAPTGQLVPNLHSWETRVLTAVRALADLFAARMEAYAKQNAPWNDQTGAARAGLRSWAVSAGTGVIIYMVHSVYYGIFLELGTSKMAPRPIIMPTLQAHYAPLMAEIRALVGG